MSECHVEHPCEACQQEREAREQRAYEDDMARYRIATTRIIDDMRFQNELDRQIAEARATLPWWHRMWLRGM